MEFKLSNVKEIHMWNLVNSYKEFALFLQIKNFDPFFSALKTSRMQFFPRFVVNVIITAKQKPHIIIIKIKEL